MKQIKLKNLIDEEEYPRDICCIQGCSNLSDLIDATHKFCNRELPLCDKHFAQISEQMEIKK